MCMKNRLSKFCKPASRLLCLLAACGLTYSCTDDYKLDDEKPADLSSSIYQGLLQGLKKGESFSTYLRLISDPDVNPDNVRPLTEVLNRTGSKTVFVANDKAFQEFFKNNEKLPEADPWHTATSYEALSAAQKKLLIHCSMLNNAIVMENLASSEASGYNSPVRGEYLRRNTDVALTDSISYLNGTQIPYHYNTKGEKDYWARFRSENANDKSKGIYLVNDGTASMMIHFTNEYLKKNNITDEDFYIIMGSQRTTEDAHIYDSKINPQAKDYVCENGYINMMDKVIKPLPNMAEVIRTNGKTNIFSHMLDRFSAPFYNDAVTKAYKNLHQEFTDSIFSKAYFSLMSADYSSVGANTGAHSPLTIGPDKLPFTQDVALKFDPGWNAFYDEVRKERDMAAMFIPSDEVLKEYFAKGGAGWILIETYCEDPGPEAPQETLEDLYKKIDQIPLDRIQSLINVIMFPSFSASVPSKMLTLKDDAQEQLFYTEDLNKIDTVLLGCNGAVYVMKKVYGPADFTSVAAPAFISKTNNIVSWAIYNGAKISSTNPDYMGLNYYAYLKAMRSEFTFFIPTDEALKFYYDPISMQTQRKRVLELIYKPITTGTGIPVQAKVYRYDINTAKKGGSYMGQTFGEQAEMVSRLKDILESHTIVHDGTNPIEGSQNEYYLTKNFSTVKIVRDENGKVSQVLGGFQLDNINAGLTDGTTGSSSCNIIQEYGQQNGTAMTLDAPIIPTSHSVYHVMRNTLDENGEKPFERFDELCSVDPQIVRACGLVDESKLTTQQQANQIKKYNIFVKDNGTDYNVQFFNNYHYTVLVPTNDAIDEAISKGLPTWEDIKADFDKCKNENEQLTTTEDSLRLQAKITYLLNFVRCHFVDESMYADKEVKDIKDFVTSSFNEEYGTFVGVKMWREKQAGETVMKITDNVYKNEVKSVIGMKNLMARDVICSAPVDETVMNMNNIKIESSSFAVVHQIDGIIHHTELVGGRHDSNWSTTNAAKKYLRTYQIR